MAKPERIIKRVNTIIRAIQDPCFSIDAPWVLYLELAKVPLGNLILILLSFGLDDVIRGYFRPKNLRRGRHGRRSRAGRRRPGALRRALRRIPGLGDDVGDTIGKRLPGGERVRDRPVSQGVKRLWVVDGVLQRGLFYWLIADAGSEFLYNWTSLIRATEFCQSQHKFAFLAKGTGGGAAAIAGWESISAPEIVKPSEAVVWNTTQGNVGPGTWTVIVAFEAQSLSSFDAFFKVRIRKTFSPTEVLGESDAEFIKSGGVGEVVAVADFQGPVNFAVEQRITTGFSVGIRCFVFITGDPPEDP